LNIDERLEEFQKALEKYMHLLKGGKVDVGKAIMVERVELEIMKMLENVDVDANSSLETVLRKLSDNGVLEEVLDYAGEKLGDPVEDPNAALESFLKGDIEQPGAKAALVAVQAIARWLADKRLESGVEERISPYCPVCGAESRTMVVEKDGYYMVCTFCSYKWRISRTGTMICPYCGSSDPIAIGVFTDRRRRLGLFVCQNCGSTWRAILDRNIRAPRILLPVIALGAEAFRGYLERSISLEGGGGDSSHTGLEEGQ